MSRCDGIKRDGGRCGAQAISGSRWCISHHPDYEDARRRRASKGGKRGGRGRPRAEVAEIKDRLKRLAEDVLAGAVGRADAAVVGQLLNIYLRAVQVEMDVREVEELERRLEQLERVLEQEEDGHGVA